MTTQGKTQETPTMFHYLLEMHKNGSSLLRLEMNVPVAAFPSVRLNSLLSLESMLLEYGKSQGFVRTSAPDAIKSVVLEANDG